MLLHITNYLAEWLVHLSNKKVVWVQSPAKAELIFPSVLVWGRPSPMKMGTRKFSKLAGKVRRWGNELSIWLHYVVDYNMWRHWLIHHTSNNGICHGITCTFIHCFYCSWQWRRSVGERGRGRQWVKTLDSLASRHERDYHHHHELYQLT